MINRRLFFALCAISLAAVFWTGCATEPEPAAVEAPVITAGDDVWSLLAGGEGDKARRFFLGEVDVNAVDDQGRTPLHYAAENRDPVLAAFFIARGAEVDAPDKLDRTPLVISAEKLDAPTAKVLAGAKADIHHSINGSNSPARIAVREAGDFLSAVLNEDSLASADSSGRTLLHLAAEAGNAASAARILADEKNLTRKDNSGKTALDIALERTNSRNHAETAELLILAGAVSENRLYTYLAPAVRSSNYNIRSADGMAPLHYIAREAYTGYLEFALEKNVNVDIKNASGATPLHEAARSGNLVIMEKLLAAGADVNVQDAKGNSVLHLAIPRDTHLEALNFFLASGANPNLRDEHGDSPLHVAVILNRPEEITGALLSGGADVTIRNADGKTPLYLAVERERSNFIPLLLSHNADIFGVDNNGVTPYIKALKEKPAMLPFLITGKTVSQNDSDGNTILHITTAAGGNTDVLNRILDHNAPVNTRNKAGDTSLTIAVRLNDEAAGELFLSRGADIFAANARGESPLSLTFPPAGANPSGLRRWMLTPQTLGAKDGLGNTALHYAAQWRLDAWIPLLVQLGAKTECANATGETPLFTAVKHNFPSTIKVLAANGALLSSRDTLGNSGLHAAVRWQARDAAAALIDLGLDINCHALNGKTPLHDSIRLGIPDIEALLLERGADFEVRDAEGNTPFMEAVLAENPGVMEQLAEAGADPNTRNFRGDTALHITAAMERTDISTLLLGWGASIHARNAAGRTPYQNALVTSPRLVRTLLTKDRLYSSDDNGSSPLHIAVRERSPLEVIQTILELGARLSSVDAEGRTALRLAVDMDLWETARLLADSGTDVFIVARDGKSAAEISLVKGEAAVKALFSGKAINAKDSSGNTILHFAAKHGNPELVSLLLSMGAGKDVKNIASESPADIALRWKHNAAAELLY